MRITRLQRAGLLPAASLSAALALASTVIPRVAEAQFASPTRAPASNGDGMDTHLFRPAIDSKGFFSVNGSDILGAGNVSFGLVLDYGHALMRTRSSKVPQGTFTDIDGVEHMDQCVDENCSMIGGEGAGVKALVQNSFQGTFGFNYGVANMATVGLSIPVNLMTGDVAYNIGRNDTGLYNSAKLDSQKLSFLALHGKLRLTRVDRGIGLAVLLQAGIPISGAPRDLGADPKFWYWPQFVIENQFGAERRFKLGLNVGFRGHAGNNPRFENAAGQSQLKEGTFEYSNLGTYNFGLSYRVLDALDLVAESYATYQLGGKSDSKQKFSNEFLGGIKLFIEQNSYLMMGAGSRAFSTGFEAADVRMVLGFVYEPSIGDRDGDGYKDDQDQCPDEPEDFDGFKDEDGCPDPDNDNDGILDVNDRCPNVPEDFDGDHDTDGCPEIDRDGDRDGDGIPDKKDKCPDDPEDKDGFEDLDGCPEPDNDHDGIPDKQDSCPDDAEDKDGFEDTDGCPDPDNDKDQIPDVKDKCPNEPETYNGFQDQDGCPDKGKVIIEGNDIVILEKVQFETGSAKILPQSNGILDAVAATLKGHPEFTVLEVAGHADERNTDAYNLNLTRLRAAAVMDALKSRGVQSNRLVSQGYGEYCPLDAASNPAAWEKNRRVEFKVVKTEDGLTGVDRGCETARDKGVIPPAVQ
ncbi:MAG TPA: OmpA family protein [Polyangiaceae bacterium]|nr:OmpA family protein [Polyangiaceae bacterium]